MQVITRALIIAKIAHHQYNTEEKREVTEKERKVVSVGFAENGGGKRSKENIPSFSYEDES